MIGRNEEYICTRKCACKERPLKVKSISTCTEDLSSIISLPNQWIPQRSGPSLTNYIKKTEGKYKATLGRMSSNISVMNSDVDKEISDLSGQLYTLTKEAHNTIKGILSNFLMAVDKSPEARDIALQEVEKIYNKNIRDIEQFKNYILHQETIRSKKLKCDLKSEYETFDAIKDSIPKNILRDFNKRISDLNEQLFTHLIMDIEFLSQLRSHLDKILKYTRSTINKNCISTSVSSDSVLWLFSYSEEKLLENNIDVKKVIMCLVDAGQCAISRICATFFNYLDDLQKNISYCVKTTVLSNVKKIIDFGLQCFVDCCAQYYSLNIDSQIRVCIDYMRHSFRGFGDNLCSTYNILYDICYILKALLVRLALARKLTLAEVDGLKIEHDAEELIVEISFNINLEEMLAGQDEEAVNKKFAVLEDLLKKQGESHYKHSLNEVKKLTEYLNLVFQVIDMFYSEFQYYFNDRSSILESLAVTNDIPLSYDLDPALLSFTKLHGFLPRTILKDKNEHTLSKLNKKFLISLGAEIPICGNILKEQSQKWIKEKSLILNTRYALKSMSHVVRMERIVAARNARITEIRSNNRRLQSHLDTIYQLTGTLTAEGAKFADFNSKELFPLEYWHTHIQNNIDCLTAQIGSQVDINTESIELKVKSYSLRVKKYGQLFEESVESAAKAYQKNAAVRLQSARVANYNVLNEVKLFSEGGRYAAIEAYKASAALVKASEAIESCMSAITKNVNGCQTQLLNRAKELLSPAMEILEKYELLYHTERRVSHHKHHGHGSHHDVHHDSHHGAHHETHKSHGH